MVLKNGDFDGYQFKKVAIKIEVSIEGYFKRLSLNWNFYERLVMTILRSHDYFVRSRNFYF
jgi:hypothetical protein